MHSKRDDAAADAQGGVEERVEHGRAESARDGIRPHDIDRLFRTEAPGLLRYFRHRLRDREAASDLVQETFLRLAGGAVGRPLDNPSAWLQRVARNLIIDRSRRKETRFAAMHQSFDEFEGAVAPEQALGIEADDLRRMYERALGELGEKTRRVFLLHRVEGLTYNEIRAQLGISIGTVEYHIMRALAHIDRVIGDA